MVGSPFYFHVFGEEGATESSGKSFCFSKNIILIRNPGQSPFVFSHQEQRDMEAIMNWMILFLAGIFEIGWAIGLKYTEGFTRFWPSIGTGAAMIISLGLLGLAMKSLPVGTAYAVWVGIGAVGTVILSIIVLGEPANAMRVISIALIIAGIIGLKLAVPSERMTAQANQGHVLEVVDTANSLIEKYALVHETEPQPRRT
jgi:quaternary ammonium compound-resistance protein SugE